MTRLTFVQCECGIELRVVSLTDNKKQIYTCGDCHQQIVLVGTVDEIHACRNPHAAHPGDWIKAPRSSISESLV